MTLEPFWRINLMLVPVVFPNNFGHTKVSTNIKTNMGHLKVSTNINKVWSHKSVDKYCLQQLDGASCCLLPPRQSQKSRPDVSVATRWEYIHNYMYKYKYKYTFCVTREQRRKDNCEELPDESVGGQVDPSDGWPEGFCQGELDSSHLADFVWHPWPSGVSDNQGGITWLQPGWSCRSDWQRSSLCRPRRSHTSCHYCAE